MTEFHKGQHIEARSYPRRPVEANRWEKGVIKFAGQIVCLVLLENGAYQMFPNKDIRRECQIIPLKLRRSK